VTAPTPVVRAVMLERACEVADCDRPIKARGLCSTHYHRWWRTGTPEGVVERRTEHGECTVDGCTNVDAGPHGYCAMHVTRVRRHGDPDARFAPAPKPGVLNPRWNEEGLGYSGAHQRVYRAKGKASAHSCIDCGDRAAHWSYDLLDPDERVGDEGRYSIDPEHYVARCVSCHSAFDRANGAVS